MNKTRINNTWVWLLASAPVIGLLLEAFIAGITATSEHMLEQNLLNQKFWYVTLIINIAFAVIDERKLKQAGVDTKAFGKIVFLIPVYLWMRAKALAQKPTYFWVWIALFVITTLAV
tara:strand:+ start:13027 stop:13377 length:351 start_codon:yes stop_codon:yes gene_type:complete